MTKRQKRALLARRLRNKADRYLKYWTQLYEDDPARSSSDRAFFNMIKEDHKDLHKAAKWLREGKEMKAAKLVVYDLDTAVRDEVPTTVYDYLEKVYYGD